MRKFFICLSTLIIFKIVFPAPVSSESIGTILTADVMSKDQNGVLTASGNVQIVQGEKVLKADTVKFFPDKNEITIQRIKEFRLNTTNTISGYEGKFNTNLSSGSVKEASILLDDLININANELVFENGDLSKADGISRVTSCDICENKNPLWYFTASSAEKDKKNSNQIYKNIRLYFKGIPFGYFPYLRLPDPSVRRARGFLNPSIELTSNLGTGIKLPYFIPIGRSRDILLTPYISPNTRTLEYRYRQVFKSGSLLIDGAISNDALKEKTFRNYVRAQGSINLNYGIGVSVDFGQVNDSAYLGDYLYHDYSDFDTNVTISKTLVNKSSFLDSRLTYTRDIEQGMALNKFLTTSLDYQKIIKSSLPKGQLALGLHLSSSANFDENNNLSRPPSFSEVSVKISNSEIFGRLHVQKSAYGDIISLVNSDNDKSINDELNLKTGAAVKLSMPFARKSEKRKQFINPQFQITFNNHTSDFTGDYFRGSDELNTANVFFGKKIASLSESELGLGISSGLQYISEWQNGQKFSGFAGHSQIENSTYKPGALSGLDLKTNNYLFTFEYLAPKYLSADAFARFTESGKLSISNLKTVFSTNKFGISTDYEFINKNTDHRLSDDLENVKLASTFSPFEGTNLTASGRYDLVLEKMAGTLIGINTSIGHWNYNFSHNFVKEKKDRLSLSAVYEDECTDVIFSIENRFQGVGTSSPILTLGFKVNFKQFTNFEFSR